MMIFLSLQNRKSPLTPRNAGFTLLELLIVIMIVGLMANFIVIAYPENSADKLAEKETRTLAQLVSLASQDALLRSRSIALHLNTKGYRFLIRNKEGLWEPGKDKLFAPRKLPKNVNIELNLSNDETQFEIPTQESAQIILSASGEITPFKIRLLATQSTQYTELTGDFGGQLKVKVHSGQQ